MPFRADPAATTSPTSSVQDTKRPKKLTLPLPTPIPVLDPSVELPTTPGSNSSTPRRSARNSPHFDYLTIRQAFDSVPSLPILPPRPSTPGTVVSTLSTITEASAETSASTTRQVFLSPSDIVHGGYLRPGLSSSDSGQSGKYVPPLPTPILETPLGPTPPIQLPGLGEFLSYNSANSSQPSLLPTLGDVDNNYAFIPEYSASSSFTASPQLLPIDAQEGKLEDPPDLTLPPLLSPSEVTTITTTSRVETGITDFSELTALADELRSLATELQKAEEAEARQDDATQEKNPGQGSADNTNKDVSRLYSQSSTGNTLETDDDGSLRDLGVCTFEQRPPEFVKRAIKKRRICAAFRQIMRLGLELPSTGLVTARDTVYPNCIWTNPVSVPFSELRPEDLILITRTGEPLNGPNDVNINHAAVAVHSAIYQERSEVDCVVSGHPLHAVAFCAVTGKRGLDMLAKDFCVFHNNHAVYTRYGGVVNGSSEASNIVAALGQNKALLMRNHGILTVGTSVESAIYWFTQLEKYCQIQLLTESTGRKRRVIGDEDARRARKIIGNERVGWFNGDLMLEMIEKEAGLKRSL
ncbi:arad-like aldolase/epimerase [Ascobolus immersus RN42]|uniref:Arad-like aldolase/epimerase n=1 Tax=Ascobolus immersus RN42 TaxID=1160509 RepID=A0A3N4IK78_ASCIM|nr:arad-like aldolase/epimerase [Ascobolus immersus RN42]